MTIGCSSCDSTVLKTKCQSQNALFVFVVNSSLPLSAASELETSQQILTIIKDEVQSNEETLQAVYKCKEVLGFI